MFVFHEHHLPADAEFPMNLEKLGYFLNDQDEVRKLKNPEEGFQYKISTNERWNDRNKAAMNACIREIVISRLHKLGMRLLRLPIHDAPQKRPLQPCHPIPNSHPAPHVPILISPNVSAASRILVIFGEPAQDLGIWAYRIAGRDSLNGGSLVNLVQCILQPNTNLPQLNPPNPMFPLEPLPISARTDQAIIIANTGQLIWHCGSQTAMSNATWVGLPRQSAVDGPLLMTYRNIISRNRNWQEHVECVFEDVLSNKTKLMKEDAKIDIIGIAEGGLAALKVLNENWNAYHHRINGICFADPIHNVNFNTHAFQHFEPHLPSSSRVGHDSSSSSEKEKRKVLPAVTLIDFLSTRGRAYLLSELPVDEPVPGRLQYGCNCYSSGEKLNAESIGAMAWPSMVKFLDQLYADPGHREVELIVEEHGVEMDA